MQQKENLKILYVSAEVAPYAKTGGLADVAGSLPKELASMGNDIRIAMPRYKTINSDMKYVADFPVQITERKDTCIIRETHVNLENSGGKKSVPVYFIDNHHYYDRDGIYCHIDDGERFAFYCKAVLEMLPVLDFKPDIIHCNDWHSGPICMLLVEEYRKMDFYKDIALLFTVHNLEYQGNFPKDVMRFFGVGQHLFTPDKVELYGTFSFMKAGLVYSDIINTVSQMYAKEIQTERYGEKLEGVLQKRSKDLYGIVNGIDYDFFNPSTDPHIYKNYSADTFEIKKENKRALQKEMEIAESDMPLISVVSRLSGQKGLDLIMSEIDSIMQSNAQFVLLGTGDEYYENAFRDIKKRYPDRVGIHLGFDASLAQRIYAGSDMFLMPSRFEPCGLGQIISLRYGTIPIVRATGGLAETIIDYEKNQTDGNGFSFDEFSSSEMMKAVKRAVGLYHNKPKEWAMLVQKALNLDYSWSKPAAKYLELYYKAINKHGVN